MDKIQIRLNRTLADWEVAPFLAHLLFTLPSDNMMSAVTLSLFIKEVADKIDVPTLELIKHLESVEAGVQEMEDNYTDLLNVLDKLVDYKEDEE